MVEVLTLKLAIDLFDHLKTYKMDLTYAQVYIWKKTTGHYQYFAFNSYDELWNFYYNRYAPFDLCAMFGDIWAVNKFTVVSSLDKSYTISISAFDVSGEHPWIRPADEFDTNRTGAWTPSMERQKQLVQNVVDEYSVYQGEMFDIYMDGVYSVCYAEPGWTVHTSRLKSYRELLFPPENANTGGFSGIVIDN